MSSVSKLFGLLALGALTATAFAATPAPPLRVCSDPNALPYSNQQQQGFENQIASMIARDLNVQLTYFWFPQRDAFFKKTLNSNTCDLVMGVPEGFDGKVATTQPYYRSTFVFVSRRDRNLHIHSLDDPRLRTLRIGVHVLGDEDSSLPPVHALVSRGIVRNLVGYSIFGNLYEANPAADLIKAVTSNQVDVAVAWGPLAGYFGQHSEIPLEVTPIDPDPTHPDLPLAFSIGLGVRPADTGLKNELNAELSRRHPEIEQILRSYGIPQLNISNAPSVVAEK